MMKRAAQWDLGRQIERPDFLLKWLPRYADWGYDQIYLYLEGAFDFPSEPGVGGRHAYTPAQMEKLTTTARRYGLQIVPIVPLLGHTSYLLQVDRLLDLSEARSVDDRPVFSGQFCPLHDGTLKLSRRLLQDVRPYCTAGLVHVGLDESFSLGTCPRCKQEVAEIGLARHFANHVVRLHGICRELGLRMGMWADMLYYVPDAIKLLPKDVIGYDWYYYPFRRLPRVEFYNFAEVDLTGDMRRAGLEVFGCPNNGCFFGGEIFPPFLDRLQLIKDWWRYGRQNTTAGMLITSWSPVRTAVEFNFIVDAAAANLWLEPGRTAPRQMLADGLQRLYGPAGRRHVPVATAVQRYQHSGNYRWQADRHWTPLANLEPVAPSRQEERHFAKLRQQAQQAKLEPLFQESLILRHYVAARQRYIQEGAQLIAQARRGAPATPLRELEKLTQQLQQLAKPALQATRALWKRSRYRTDPNSMVTILRTDQKRLREVLRFVAAARRNPQHVHRSSPLFGQWQFLLWVRNFAPALQGSAVERLTAQGDWETLHAVYSLEFLAEAGQPRADFRRRHGVAIDWDGKTPLRLRIAVRGSGQLEIYGAKLTNGVTTVTPTRRQPSGGTVRNARRLTAPRRPGAVLGSRAPRSGFDPIDWGGNAGWVELEFPPDTPGVVASGGG